MFRLLVTVLMVFLYAHDTAALTAEQEKIARAEYPTPTLLRLWHDQQTNPQAAQQYFDALAVNHIIEPNKDGTATVTYFAQGSANTDYILQSGGPDFYGLRFKQIGQSHIYYCTQTIPSDAWFNYGVNEFTRTTVAGTADLQQHSMRHIYDGAVIGPDAPLSKAIVERDNLPAGALHDVSLSSQFMGEQRKIQVYVPDGYNENMSHNLLIQLDGQNFSTRADHGPPWHGWTPLPTILDNLIHSGTIGPTIAVFVHNQGKRSTDLLSEQMTDFIALEILPWIKRHYSISSEPKQTVISGPSRAGFAAAHTAFRHAAVIGSVLSQSGSFYYTLSEQKNWPVYPEFEGQLIDEYKQAATKDIQFYLDVGLYDLGLAAVGTNRQFKDVLQLKGYGVQYYEYNGGHAHLGWRHTIARGLTALLGNTTTPRSPTTQVAHD